MGGRGQCGTGVSRRPGRAVAGAGAAGGPLVELDLEGEPVGEVAVLGPGDRAAVGAAGQPPHDQQRGAGHDVERAGVVLPATAAVMVWRTRGDRGGRARPRLLHSAGVGGVVAATASRRARRGTHSSTRSSGTPLDGAHRPAVQRLVPLGEVERAPRRTRGAGCQPKDTTCRAELVAGLGDRGGGVPEGAEGEPLAEGAAGHEPAGAAAALDQPPLAQQLERLADGHPAHRVPRARAAASLSSCPEGSTSPRTIRSRSSSATCRYRAPVIDLYAT